METSLLLAQLIGTYFVLMGITMFMRKNMIDNIVDGFERNKALTLMVGIFVFAGGFLMVSAHNVWEASWVGFITLLAWATMLKGAAYMVCPDHMISKAHWFIGKAKMQKVASVAVIIIGLYLAYIGFGIGA